MAIFYCVFIEVPTILRVYGITLEQDIGPICARSSLAIIVVRICIRSCPSRMKVSLNYSPKQRKLWALSICTGGLIIWEIIIIYHWVITNVCVLSVVSDALEAVLGEAIYEMIGWRSTILYNK